ncbi:unnamed protein product [Vitrella brassicaformis CCMP3155]|uniref:Uncharacterized protein n=2 Tax=Vitrella brassicaformis TaxID=1169539 RepID=A0A0G4ENT1_VITBC|nr:unnamed protein product [Vitrella brassicaformis CCMP3155]|eukprot:CEL99268.1 unnamed protein product [Vitrella brassicaformis CCMP3155]
MREAQEISLPNDVLHEMGRQVVAEQRLADGLDSHSESQQPECVITGSEGRGTPHFAVLGGDCGAPAVFYVKRRTVCGLREAFQQALAEREKLPEWQLWQQQTHEQPDPAAAAAAASPDNHHLPSHATLLRYGSDLIDLHCSSLTDPRDSTIVSLQFAHLPSTDTYGFVAHSTKDAVREVFDCGARGRGSVSRMHDAFLRALAWRDAMLKQLVVKSEPAAELSLPLGEPTGVFGACGMPRCPPGVDAAVHQLIVEEANRLIDSHRAKEGKMENGARLPGFHIGFRVRLDKRHATNPYSFCVKVCLPIAPGASQKADRRRHFPFPGRPDVVARLPQVLAEAMALRDAWRDEAARNVAAVGSAMALSVEAEEAGSVSHSHSHTEGADQSMTVTDIKADAGASDEHTSPVSATTLPPWIAALDAKIRRRADDLIQAQRAREGLHPGAPLCVTFHGYMRSSGKGSSKRYKGSYRFESHGGGVPKRVVYVGDCSEDTYFAMDGAFAQAVALRDCPNNAFRPSAADASSSGAPGPIATEQPTEVDVSHLARDASHLMDCIASRLPPSIRLSFSPHELCWRVISLTPTCRTTKDYFIPDRTPTALRRTLTVATNMLTKALGIDLPFPGRITDDPELLQDGPDLPLGHPTYQFQQQQQHQEGFEHGGGGGGSSGVALYEQWRALPGIPSDSAQGGRGQQQRPVRPVLTKRPTSHGWSKLPESLRAAVTQQSRETIDRYKQEQQALAPDKKSIPSLRIAFKPDRGHFRAKGPHDMSDRTFPVVAPYGTDQVDKAFSEALLYRWGVIVPEEAYAIPTLEEGGGESGTTHTNKRPHEEGEADQDGAPDGDACGSSEPAKAKTKRRKRDKEDGDGDGDEDGVYHSMPEAVGASEGFSEAFQATHNDIKAKGKEMVGLYRQQLQLEDPNAHAHIFFSAENVPRRGVKYIYTCWVKPVRRQKVTVGTLSTDTLADQAKTQELYDKLASKFQEAVAIRQQQLALKQTIYGSSAGKGRNALKAGTTTEEEKEADE